MTSRPRTIRRAILAPAALALGLLAALAGCGRQDTATGPQAGEPALPSAPAAPSGPATKSVAADTLDQAIVQFDDRTFDGQQTTFSWRLSGRGRPGDLGTFFLELPPCAPEVMAFSPPGAVFGDHPDTALSGIRWNVALGEDDPFGVGFQLVFAGDVDLGVVRTAVSLLESAAAGEQGDAGRQGGSGSVLGPCGGGAITGTVFVDTDSSGIYDPATEGGLAGVLVRAVDAQGQVEATLTDSTGAFELLLLEGTYTVRVDTTAAAGFFNPELGTWWTPTTALDFTVEVPPGATGVDFGFQPTTDQVLEDLEDGDLRSLGVPLDFWIAELMFALDPVPVPEGIDPEVLPYDTPTYTPAELLDLLQQVQQQALPQPYQFTAGEEFAEALAILAIGGGEPVDILLAELLATELNLVSGRAFEDDTQLLPALVLWGESIVVQAGGVALAQDAAVRVAIDVFRTFNVGGGGGFDGK